MNMRTILGPFHPHLEDALVNEILRFKASDPFCALLILVPSDLLRRRVKILLARERGLALVNLQILSFHQLSLKLFTEATGALSPVLYQDLFLEEALRQLIRARSPGTEAFFGIAERSGGCAALWQTLRDLRDGLVDPSVALEALREGHFAQRTGQRTSDLLELLQRLVRFCAEHGIKDHSDLDKHATAHAPQSELLKQFSHIFYYGFYDLTQVQLEFFEAVARTFPVTLFFPLLACRPPHEAWSFAERFYQRYLQGRSGGAPADNMVEQQHTCPLPATFAVFDQVPHRAFQPLPKHWHCALFNAFGIHDEVSAVAKEIVRLVDRGGGFDEIGVVARTLDSYGATIREIFARHQIPIATAIEEPLVQFPLTQAVMLLLNLAAKDYPRADVIELLSSPYFRPATLENNRGDLRPDLWDLATRELAICKGLGEWQRLQNYTVKDMVLAQKSADDEPRLIKIPAAQLRALAAIVKRMAGHLSRIPPAASWSRYSTLWNNLLNQYLGIARNAGNDTSIDARTAGQIADLVDQMAGLDAVQAEVSLREFGRTLQRWLERAVIAAPPPSSRGVAVLNATAARGIAFRALFLVGMNEGIFPRTIREDAFVRDRDREVLERDLGYKVSQKFAAFDEEKLLFTLLVNAARERLYCSFQRADENGRALAPSWYIGELKRALAGYTGEITETMIPRSISDKDRCAPFNDENLLLPEELAVRLSVAGEEAVSLVEAAELSPALYKSAVKTVERLDLGTQRLDEYDGMVADIAPYRQHFLQRGLSPTALELYGRCPFQYFARQVIGLERLDTPEESEALPVADYGDLGHAILKTVYQELIERGFFTSHSPVANTEQILAAAAERAFAEYETDHPVGYALAWQAVREALIATIRSAIDRDLKELGESGYTPAVLELDITDQLPVDWPEELRGTAIRGRMDRIDIDLNRQRLRIVDYKFKIGTGPASADRELVRAALRGERLQPPIYSLLGARWAELERAFPAAFSVETSFFYIAPKWKEGPLSVKSFLSEDLSGKIGDGIKATILDLVQGIRSGRFFIQPGPHCRYCDVAEICRKNHPPSLWRAENDPIAEAHRRLRDNDPKHL